MSIINTFDNETEEIVKADKMISEIEEFPEVAIMIFKEKFIDYMQEEYGMKIIGHVRAGSFIPIYKINYKGKDFAIIRTLIGGAGTAGMTEELIAMGAKKILIYGTCGTLDKNILKGHFVIPTAAYRDEGVSYHYMPSSDFVDIPTSNELASIFKELDIPYVKGKTWTTDALYRETRGNMEKRKKDGCIVVEMECASIMSVGIFRNIPIYQFLYGDDTLDGSEWDRRKLEDNEKQSMDRKIINIGFEIAYKIGE